MSEFQVFVDETVLNARRAIRVYFEPLLWVRRGLRALWAQARSLVSAPHLGQTFSMQIEVRAVGGVTVLDLRGKMTIGEGDELLRERINGLIEQGNQKIVLNLAEVPYIDSAGLGEIVHCYTTVNRAHGKLKLLNLTKRIHDLLAITKLVTVFETYDSEDEAVKSFLNPASPSLSKGTIALH